MTRFVFLLLLAVSVSGIHFEFDTDCSFELPSGKCVACKHTLFERPKEVSCQDPDIIGNLPKPVTIRNITAIDVSGNIRFILEIEMNLTNMESLDLKILWYKKIGRNGHYGLAQHRSTLEFLNLEGQDWTELNDTRVVIYLTLYGVLSFASYDIQGVSHPNCYGSGISKWKSFDYDNSTVAKSFSDSAISDISTSKNFDDSTKSRTCVLVTGSDGELGLPSESTEDKKEVFHLILKSKSSLITVVAVLILFILVLLIALFIKRKRKEPRTLKMDDDGAVMKAFTINQLILSPFSRTDKRKTFV